MGRLESYGLRRGEDRAGRTWRRSRLDGSQRGKVVSLLTGEGEGAMTVTVTRHSRYLSRLYP